MKIVLAALNAKYVHSNLAIRYLKREIEDYDVELYESTINDDILKVAFEILDKGPNVVGFSCYIWNIENTLKVANIIKNINSDIKIILGGPEVSFDATSILSTYNFVDYIIKGEGERVIRPLIECINEDSLSSLTKIKGLSFRYNNEIIDTGYSDTIMDMDTLKFPYESEIPDKIIYYEASRGCPFRCSYCMSSIDKKVRVRSLELVKKELKYLIENNVKLIKFVDRTFNANKSYSREIWKYLIDLSPSTCFHFEIAADLLDEEDLNILSNAPKGLFQFEIGVQSTNECVLKNINRTMNFKKVKENIERILKVGNIHCHLDLIVGLPGEDIISFKKSFNDVMSIMPDELQIGFLKVLKGSPIFYDKDKYGIKYLSYPPYHVLKTDWLKSEEIYWLLNFEKVFDSFYNSRIFERTISYVLNNTSDYFKFFEDLTTYLQGYEFFERNVGLQEKFFLLFNFLIQKYEVSIIKDLLIYDYLFTTKKSNLPEFLRKDIDTKIDRKFKKYKENIMKKLNLESMKGLFILPMSLEVCKNNNKFDIIYNEVLILFDLKNQISYTIHVKDLE
ncbi:B12-binding domain-containing radical SAM protein [Thermobrachium celere]|uniref:B12-binding domain-containing radical SAM protein n=1 Tax=Thermobrachium celere TaxID=53422 RepID=UPI0005945A75|nr:B12-binding domain-containing radical SAM protein [Thermobrachium celere]